MIRRIKTLMILLVLALVTPAAGQAAMELESMQELTPGEEYRRLSLLMLVTGVLPNWILPTINETVTRIFGG